MYKQKKIKVSGIEIQVRDLSTSNTIEWVEKELNAGDYNLSNIAFAKGDYVIDCGANVGITGIYLAKKHPDIKVFSFEPLLDNYINLLHNRWLNGVANLYCFHAAIGYECGLIDIAVNAANTGGSYTQPGESYVCYDLPTVLKVIKKKMKRKAKLLKVDVEGFEKEIFKMDYTPYAENLSIETHGELPENVLHNIHLFKQNLWIKKA